QDRFTAENVVSELQKIVPDGAARRTMIEKLAEVKIRLRGEQQDHLHPADRTAEAVLALLPGARAGAVTSRMYSGVSQARVRVPQSATCGSSIFWATMFLLRSSSRFQETVFTVLATSPPLCGPPTL